MSGNVLSNDADKDAGVTLQVSNPGIYQGQYGTLNLGASGAYSYTLDHSLAPVQCLRGGETLSDVFAYSATDGMAAVSSALTIRITGANDAPDALSDVAAATEDQPSAITGNVLANDTDVDAGTTLRVANAGTFQGTYGTLVLGADGQYSYVLDNASLVVQSLQAGQTVHETFSYAVVDDDLAPASEYAALEFAITGRNDAPVLVQALQNQNAEAGEHFSYAFAANTFADVDAGDVLAYTATLKDGSPLPAWLAFDAATRTFSGIPVGSDIVISVTATDTSGARSTADFSLTVRGGVGRVINGTVKDDILAGTPYDDIIDGKTGRDVMSGGKGNDVYYVDAQCPPKDGCGGKRKGKEGLGKCEDPPPPGQDTNQNGGPGTSPGNLGNKGRGKKTSQPDRYQDRYDDHHDHHDHHDHRVSCTVDEVVEHADEGYDTVLSSVTYTLSANLEALHLRGTADLDGTGNALDNALYGNQGKNLLNGGAGDDWLDGGAGTDVLMGGLGNDTYVVDSECDTVSESVNAGIDLIWSSVDYTLGANLENLMLSGTSSIHGTGNCLSNILFGNAGDNTLDGGAGADSLSGGAGNDTYIVDDIGDCVAEAVCEGVDQVQASISHTLSDNVEVLTLTGKSAIAGTGNAGDNLIKGNSAGNILNGGDGVDLLQGGAGADTILDTSGNNLLDGGAGHDALIGGDGNDWFAGGTGNDVITTGSGADVIAFNRGDGQDTVLASGGKDNTLSLGKGVKYADLLFKKSSNDLILVTGSKEQITFKDWYARDSNRSIANLQVVIEGSSQHKPGSSNPLNNKVEWFDFNGLVAKFDRERAAKPSLSSWSLASSMLNFHLAGSDTAAIGGDLAYQYAKNGSLSALSMAPANAVISSATFGKSAQNLRGTADLQHLSPCLM